jgi:hypothetical protein
LLKRDLLTSIVELRIYSAQALREEGVPSGQLKKELRLGRGDNVLDTPGDVLRAGVKVGVAKVLNSVEDPAFATTTYGDRLLVFLGYGTKNLFEGFNISHTYLYL